MWAGSYRNATRYQLRERGMAVAMDRERIVWAAAVGKPLHGVVSWDRRSSRSKPLCRLPGLHVPVAQRPGRGVGDDPQGHRAKVWVYDFASGKAYEVSAGGGRQVSPVIVAGSVYWADDRSGHWELYARSLQH